MYFFFQKARLKKNTNCFYIKIRFDKYKWSREQIGYFDLLLNRRHELFPVPYLLASPRLISPGLPSPSFPSLLFSSSSLLLLFQFPKRDISVLAGNLEPSAYKVHQYPLLPWKYLKFPSGLSESVSPETLKHKKYDGITLQNSQPFLMLRARRKASGGGKGGRGACCFLFFL